jgi:hypothetical protein
MSKEDKEKTAIKEALIIFMNTVLSLEASSGKYFDNLKIVGDLKDGRVMEIHLKE